MPRPSRGLETQVALRVSKEMLDEAGEIAKLLSRPEIGYRATKADALRVALERGFKVLRDELKPSKSKK